MIDLFQARRESHEARELGHDFKIQEGGVSLEVPRVEGQAFYPSGDAPRVVRDGTPMENIKEGLADLPKAVGSAGAGLAAGAAGLPGDLVSLIGGLGSALFPGDQSRMEAFTSTMTDISETIGSERFLGLYRDIVNNSDFSLEDKQMMLDTAEGASFLSIPGAATVAKGSSDAIRSGVVKAGEAAQARLDEAAGSTTLAAGVDVGKGIDQAIAAAGRASSTTSASNRTVDAVVFHGTKDKFDIFDMSKAEDGAHFFTVDKDVAENFGDVSQYRIRMKNPYVITDEQLESLVTQADEDAGIIPRDKIAGLVQQAKADGFDGLVIEGFSDVGKQADAYLPFNSEQISPVTDPDQAAVGRAVMVEDGDI